VEKRSVDYRFSEKLLVFQNALAKSLEILENKNSGYTLLNPKERKKFVASLKNYGKFKCGIDKMNTLYSGK
jgi:hypothetical protein